MLTHNIQRKIIRSLALHESVAFAQLRPANTESNVFTYHLNTLIKEGYIQKADDGYQLTALGKMLGINSHLSAKEWLSQAHAVVFVVVHDKRNDRWLVRKRKAQPMYDYVGFLHFEPEADTDTLDLAKDILKTKVGITAEFAARGCGYARFFRDGDLQSFTTFTIVEATEYTGDITTQTETGHNYWASYAEIAAEAKLLPTMLPIFDKLRKSSDMFYLDMNFNV